MLPQLFVEIQTDAQTDKIDRWADRQSDFPHTSLFLKCAVIVNISSHFSHCENEMSCNEMSCPPSKENSLVPSKINLKTWGLL